MRREVEGSDDENGLKRRVSCRLSSRYFFFHILTSNWWFLDFIYVLTPQYGSGRAALTYMGPNDAKRVLWPLVRLFLSFIRVSFALTHVYRFYSFFDGLDGQRWWELAQTTKTHRLDHRYFLKNILLFFIVFFIY